MQEKHRLDTRGSRLVVPWLAFAACLLPITAQAQLRLRPYAVGFSSPIAFVQDPTDAAVHFVVEQGGRVRATKNGALLSNDFLDLRNLVGCCGERGLLGLAFAPDYAASRRFFVNYTNMNGDTVVARYKRSAGDPLVADPTSRFDLRWTSIAGSPPYIEHSPEFGNHNGGNLAFGPDGYLYIGMGDGGSGDDPNNRGQSPDTLLAKMLRIDVSVPDGDVSGYRVPADNPFVGGSPVAALPEIWDFGVRNPWRFSFDVGSGGTGALVIADVGQGRREEVDYEPPGQGGRNYGWRVREGTLANIAGPTAFGPLTGSDLRVRPFCRLLDYRRIRVPRHGAAACLPRPIFLRGFHRRADLVDGPQDRSFYRDRIR